MLWLLRYLPQNLISTLVGKLMHFELPGSLRVSSIRFFAKMFSINIEEAEKPLEGYDSIGDFFVRKLKMALRPKANVTILHPADALISAAGIIESGQIMQVKNWPYSVAQILGNVVRASDLEGGFFATYYLCPTDYHRVHSPVTGKIISADHFPGKLWPVFKKSVESIKNLFSVNERMVVCIETDLGKVYVVFVGAMNVGRIELAVDPHFYSQDSNVNSIRSRAFTPAHKINAGDELGLFRMGSTVVVFYPNNYCQFMSQQNLQDLIGQVSKVRSGMSTR